jgi:hypothetical protein
MRSEVGVLSAHICVRDNNASALASLTAVEQRTDDPRSSLPSVMSTQRASREPVSSISGTRLQSPLFTLQQCSIILRYISALTSVVM